MFECDYVRGEPEPIGCAALKWVAVGQLKRYAFPAANVKIIAALLTGRKESTRRRMQLTG